MRKVISILICEILIISSLIWITPASVEAAGSDTPVRIELGKEVEGSLESGITNLYEIKPKHIGILSIIIKGYVNDELDSSFYSGSNADAKLEHSAAYDENAGYSVTEYKVFVNPHTYYLKLSNPVIVLNGTYKIKTEFTPIEGIEAEGNNTSTEAAAVLRNNKYYIGVMAFEDMYDYYSISFKKEAKLKFQISCIGDSSVKIAIIDSTGHTINEGFGFDTTRPYIYDNTVAPGKYTLMITRNNLSADHEGLDYAITTGSYIPIKKISLSSSKTLIIGSTYTLKPVLTPSNATGDYIFTTSNSKIVNVNKDGKITALKIGSAVITVKTVDGSIKDTCKVIVKNSVSKITLNKSKLSLFVGGSATLTASISPSSASKSTVTWVSSNTKVAAVNSSGKVTAKGKGTCTITAKAGGKSDTVTVTVKEKPKPTPTPKPTPKPTPTPKPKPTVTPTPKPTIVAVESLSVTSSVNLSVGEIKTLSVRVLPYNATDKSLTWSSKDNSVAAVNGGRITARKVGTTTIIAVSSNGKKAYCTVIVSE